MQNDEAVEAIIQKIDELRRDREAARRNPAATCILERSKHKSLGGIAVRGPIEEGLGL